MVDRRVEAVVERFDLPADAGSRLECLLSALVTDPDAPTAIRDRADAIDDHLADSLVGLSAPQLRGASSVADLGSGAGLPGLPLAIALPRTRFLLVESASRKCAFLARVAVRCELSNVEVVHARAEEVGASSRGKFDVVTARALAAPAIVAEYAAPLLRIGGTVVMWRGRRDVAAEADAEVAAEALGLSVVGVVPVHPHRAVRERHLYLMSKVAPTPERFPRRPGMAVKRPLGRR